MQVQIMTPSKVVTKGEAASVQLPGSLGYMGILPGHARMIAELGTGELVLEGTAGKSSYFLAGGFVDVESDEIKVLADVVEKVTDIDTGRAEKARQRALDRLNDKSGTADTERARLALKRAETRIALAVKPK